ncbi:MAG: hypothetical protein ACM3SY_04325 [Candidatus Omnitrophota bacterium]
MPSPVVALFYNNTPFNELIGFIDSGIRLRIEEPKFGQNVFSRLPGVALDLSWLLLVIATPLVMAWGLFAFRNKKYIRFLMSSNNLKAIYTGIILARVLVLFLYLAALYLMVILQFFLRGIFLNAAEYYSIGLFFSLLFVVWVIFLLISSALGAGSNWITGAAIIFFMWLTCFLVWPEVANTIISIKAENENKGINFYETKKLKILTDHSLKASKIAQKYKDKSEDEKFAAYRKFSEEDPKITLKEINDVNEELIQNTQRNIKVFNFISIFNPAMFLKATDNELSSLGFKSYMGLCNSIKGKQNQFFYYILFKRLDTKDKFVPHVRPFLPPEKCIIPLVNQLPFYFGWGLLILFTYLIGALYFSYFRLSRYIKPVFHIKKFQKYPVDVSWIKNNRVNGFYTRKEIYLDFFPWMLAKKKITVMVVPCHHHIPGDVRIDSLFSACSVEVPKRFKLIADKTFADLDEDLATSILIEIVKSNKKCEYFIFKDFMHSLSMDTKEEFKHAMARLKKNSTVIYMSSTIEGINQEYFDHFFQDLNEEIIV